MVDWTNVIMGLITLLGGCGWVIDRKKHKVELRRLEAEVKALKAGKTAATAPLEEEKARESFHLKPDERDFVEVDDCIFADNI